MARTAPMHRPVSLRHVGQHSRAGRQGRTRTSMRNAPRGYWCHPTASRLRPRPTSTVGYEGPQVTHQRDDQERPGDHEGAERDLVLPAGPSRDHQRNAADVGDAGRLTSTGCQPGLCSACRVAQRQRLPQEHRRSRSARPGRPSQDHPRETYSLCAKGPIVAPWEGSLSVTTSSRLDRLTG